jgi:hypothetical protein
MFIEWSVHRKTTSDIKSMERTATSMPYSRFEPVVSMCGKFISHIKKLKYSFSLSTLQPTNFDTTHEKKQEMENFRGWHRKRSPCALTEHHAMKAYWGSGSTAPRILWPGTRWRLVVSFMPWPLYPQGKSPWYPLDRLDGPQEPVIKFPMRLSHKSNDTIAPPLPIF